MHSCDAYFIWLIQRGGGSSSITSCLCWDCHFHNTGTRVAISRPPKESECVRFMWDRVHTRRKSVHGVCPFLQTDNQVQIQTIADNRFYFIEPSSVLQS